MDTLTLIIVTVLLVVTVVILWRAQKKPGTSSRLANLAQAAEIAEAEKEILRLKTESTRDSDEYKEKRKAYNEKYKNTGRTPLRSVPSDGTGNGPSEPN